MLTLLFVLLVVIAVVCAVIYQKIDNGYLNCSFLELTTPIIGVGSGIIAIAMLICIACEIYTVGTAYTIDEKIAMYEEENIAIEETLDTIVQQYMEYEGEVFANAKPDVSEVDSMILVSMYPELKSDTLVQTQMEVYAANNAKLKELREEKIEISKHKWSLYFGR